MQFDWQKSDAGHVARIGDITLCASPDRVRFGKPVRGTKWHASVSSWCERTRTMSRFGRDVYLDLRDSAKDAMRLAEQVYAEAQKVDA